MPHLVIETTANLGTYPKAQALKELAASLTAHPQIPVEADLKIRFVDVTDFVMGTEPEARGFVHAELRLLSGRTHRVLSAVALIGAEERQVLSTSEVSFRPISDQEARAYWASGEPLDKAGGYAIQGSGAVFARELRGSYSGVMGLPLFETARLLAAEGILVLGAGHRGT